MFEDSKVKRLSSTVEDFDGMKSSVTYFEIPHISAGAEQVFTSELHTKAQSAHTLSASLPSEYIRGLGRYSVSQPELLSTDRDQLEVSDLIIGYNNEESSAATNPYGFRIAPKGHIPQGQNIIVHFEVYHVQKPANAPARFKIDYLLEPHKNFLQRVLKTDDPNQVSLTLNFESDRSSYRDNLEISTSEFEPGAYTLTFTVTEQTTGQQETRETTIRIIE